MPAPQRPVDEHGFPLPAKFAAPAHEPASPAEKATRARRWGRWKWALFLFLPAILFAPRIYDLGCDYFAGLQIERAVREIRRGDFVRAELSLDRAVKWQPAQYRHWSLFEMRAEVRQKTKNLSGAVEDYSEALRLLAKDRSALSDPFLSAQLYMQRAWLAERLGNHRAALADATTAIGICPADDRQTLPNLLNTRAYICALSGWELETGLRDINRALAGHEDDPIIEWLDTRAYLLLKLGKPNEALVDIQKALALQDKTRQVDDQNLAVIFHHRSEIYEKLGKNDAAKADADRAKRLGYDPAQGVL